MNFECCQFESIDWESKTVQLTFPNWKEYNQKFKAGKDITKNLGLISLTAP